MSAVVSSIVASMGGVDGSRRNGLAICRVEEGRECRLTGLSAGFVRLHRRPEAELVSLVLDATVASVDLAEIVRADNMSM